MYINSQENKSKGGPVKKEWMKENMAEENKDAQNKQRVDSVGLCSATRAYLVIRKTRSN